MAVDYIVSEFERIGLQPGMPDGSWVQHFPILAQQTDRNTSLRVTQNGRTVHNFSFWSGTYRIPGTRSDRSPLFVMPSWYTLATEL